MSSFVLMTVGCLLVSLSLVSLEVTVGRFIIGAEDDDAVVVTDDMVGATVVCFILRN